MPTFLLRIFTTTFAITLIVSTFAQNPCSSFTSPTPDSTEIAELRQNFYLEPACYAVKKSLNADGICNPYIDGEIDEAWSIFPATEIKRTLDTTSQDGIDIMAKWFCDDVNFYVLLIITGDEYSTDTIRNNMDKLTFYYQNSWGGKGNAAEHNDDPDWNNWYWKHDGDRIFSYAFDSNSTAAYRIYDNDPNNDLSGDDCEWYYYEERYQLTDTTSLGHEFAVRVHGDSAIVELAMEWEWLDKNFSQGWPPPTYDIGFDISYTDMDEDTLTNQYNLNDPGNNAWAYTPALAKFNCDCHPGSSVEKKQLSGIQIFPNPSTGTINISSVAGRPAGIQLYNLTGQKVHQVKGEITSVDLSHLKKGIYFAKVLLQNQQPVVKKIILE